MEIRLTKVVLPARVVPIPLIHAAILLIPILMGCEVGDLARYQSLHHRDRHGKWIHMLG